MRCVRQLWRIRRLLLFLDHGGLHEVWWAAVVVGGGRLPSFCRLCSYSGCEPCTDFVVAGGSGVFGCRFLSGGVVVELLHLQFFALWFPGENLGSGLLDRMPVLCP